MNVTNNWRIATATLKAIEAELRSTERIVPMPGTAALLADALKTMEAVKAELTGTLEECLSWFEERYDQADNDEDGRPLPNEEMKIGQMVDEVLHGIGF